MRHHGRPRDGRGRGALPALALAAAVGLVHAAFSLYWALGGSWLLETLGVRVVQTFADMRWVLLPVAAVKGGFALLPLWWHTRSWPLARLSRGVSWVGAAILILWGGSNTVVAHLVLGGVITPDGGVDRPGMLGHAWLWDPLFLLWGAALAVGLARGRSGGSPPASPSTPTLVRPGPRGQDGGMPHRIPRPQPDGGSWPAPPTTSVSPGRYRGPMTHPASRRQD